MGAPPHINEGELLMPYKDITYDNGSTERFYYNETPLEEAKRMARMNRVASFPSANHRAKTHRKVSTNKNGLMKSKS